MKMEKTEFTHEFAFFAVTDEEELDDLLSYRVDAYRMQKEDEKPDTSNIDYWINLSRGDADIN